ncbi:DMT family transporter [Desulfogranum mediterraneum]|uniref:DMT family transporter n=1 Tax=Desulfogranum mediterraneum TaxID=160661 RepID=UPI000424EB88|nr:DMT family transporter [Desulfogranum mediterraneum]
MKPSTWQVHGCVLISTTLAATSFTVGKAIAPALEPTPLILLRFCCAALLFFPYIRWRHELSLPSLHDLGRYSLISGVLVGFFWLMFFALRFTSALNTGAIFTLVPGISSIYSALLVKERLGRYRLAALFTAMAGALWVIFQGDPARLLSLELNQGDLIFFSGCLLMALYTPLVRLLHRGEPMAIMTFWVLVTGCGWLLLLGGYSLFSIPWLEIAPRVWAGIVYLAVFTTIITFFISQWATLHLGPTRVIAYSYLYPLVIVIIQWLLGAGLPPTRTLVGVALILPAMLILQRGKRSRQVRGGDHFIDPPGR